MKHAALRLALAEASDSVLMEAFGETTEVIDLFPIFRHRDLANPTALDSLMDLRVMLREEILSRAKAPAKPAQKEMPF